MVRLSLTTLFVSLALAGCSSAAPKVFRRQAASVTKVEATLVVTAADSKFGALIEGAGADSNGHIFSANFGAGEKAKNTLGVIVGPKAQTLFYTDANAEAWFNSVRVIKSSAGEASPVTLLTGDVTGHRVLKVTGVVGEGQQATATEFCSDPEMLQPNDLAVTSKGAVYTSGMNYTATTEVGSGDLWWCSPTGEALILDRLERTNGIEVSPGNKYLYLSEAKNREGAVTANTIWRYEIDPVTGVRMENNVPVKQQVIDFAQIDDPAVDIDGMRCDAKGNLYVTRNGRGEVAVFDPNYKLITVIDTKIKAVKNLEFGGTDGKTLYMVGNCDDDNTKGCASTWQGEAAGLEWTLLNKKVCH
ncbi:hypothetical protein H4R34_002367 [Dimargaris verticillata]|uniref:SMP-30/Gluconolactonase/LRE-like region domain-containing protein n=1 Tax=Dimargaris verticillata TaxID=2761393 RepID=A0A9W8B2Q0_9FUNG|nr:hypothetical protein H4R34_002367 [Dimargaris verticillata]